ncbi:MAG TPA: adenylate/guanylate cyclase domain-containing protein [Gaiellaceae bacterium]|nr:adenylate/guanylate cyclase domain-containing protein [Gaiellaceae bacterium]
MSEVRGHAGVDVFAADATTGTRPDFVPYVPRIVVDWLKTDAQATWRALEGTLAFVDISGFTAMSERLARQGKVGAEEVSDVMSATFTRLLDVAYAEGGGLVKFGGDALLLFFAGEAHAARATRAAFGMRRALREIGHPRTSAGQVSLRMHVGVHSDTFHFFLVGDTHRELLVTGPGATTTVGLEDVSEAGEILLSAAAADGVPASVLGEAKAGGWLLRSNVPGEPAGLEPLPEVAGLDLSLCVPEPIREHLAAGPAEPEHRRATVAFVHFDGTDAMIEREGPAATAEALAELVTTTQKAAAEHGVCVFESDIDADGGKLVLVAGVPQTAGDDEERMLRTLCAVSEAGLRLPLRIGVNQGRVFAGEVGAPFRRTYTILGETAALAARLMSKAEPGQVLASDDVLERTTTAFETTELAPFPVKGKTEPVVAHDVHRPAGAKEAPEGRMLPFVGREREVAILTASLAPVRLGFGSLVELTGEPGIGKSRLVTELQAQCTDMTIVTTGCEQYELSTPYFAFRGLLRSLLGMGSNGSAPAALRTKVEALCPELIAWLPLVALAIDVEVEPTPEVEELQPAFRRARLHGVIEELLAKLLPTPTLVIIEDVHWMDEPSSDLLRHLGGQVSGKPWLLCATRRPTPGGFVAAEGVPPVPALTIQLEPLTEEAAGTLIAAAAAEGLLQHEVAAIAERGAGNPLFLQELVATEHAAEELPETVETVVATRIDKLAPGDRALLRYAAVMGTSFSGELIADVLAGDDAASADSEAWDRVAEFVERDPYTAGAFRFRHALFRDAAYEGLSFKRRRELHARVGEVYETRYGDSAVEQAELLSLHFFHAQQHEKAYRYSLVAGNRAQEKYANVEAAVFYRRALEAARRLPDLDSAEVAGVWESLGDVSELAGLYTDAANAYKSARRVAERAELNLPMLLLKEGVIRDRLSRYSDALRWYRRALEAAEAVEDELERANLKLEINLAYAGTRYRQGEFKDCIQWCDRVVEQAAPEQDLRALAHAYYLLHLAYTSIGSPDRAAYRGLALPIYEEIGDLLGQANVLNNLGIDAYYEGRWNEALKLYERSREANERVGNVVGAATLNNNIGEIRSDQGHLDEAAAQFHELKDLFDAAGHRTLAALTVSNLGRLAARSGRLDEALDLLRRALVAFHEIRAGSFELETKARLAERAVLAGEPTEALRHADEALRTLADGEAPPALLALLHRVRGYALLQLGDPDGAEQCLDESIRVAREGDSSYELALSLGAAARLRERTSGNGEGESSEAARLLESLGVVSVPEVPLPPVGR